MAIGSARATSRFDDWEDQICSTFVPLQARCVERTPRLIRRDDPELYKFGLQVSGTSVIEQGDREAYLHPGDLAIYDTSRPYRITFSDDFRMTVAMFPRTLVRLPKQHMAGLTAVRLAGDSGLGSLIAPLMRGLSAELGATGAVIAGHLGEAVVDLVTAAFAQQLQQPLAEGSTALHRSLVAQVHQFIDRNLHDPQLSSKTIADTHFVSVRQLQKVFEAEGTSVSALIRGQRLERCRLDLADPRLADQPVTIIGQRWRFPDAAHFSRLFRSTYGEPPRDYRRARAV